MFTDLIPGAAPQPAPEPTARERFFRLIETALAARQLVQGSVAERRAALDTLQGEADAALLPLLDQAARGLPEMALVAVHGSVPFWQRHGFTVVEAPALAEKLASYGEDARYMKKII